jgi:hypothetical protein
VIPREHAEPAGVLGQALVDGVLGTEVGDEEIFFRGLGVPPELFFG